MVRLPAYWALSTSVILSEAKDLAYWALPTPVILSEAKNLAYWDSSHSCHSEAQPKNLSYWALSNPVILSEAKNLVSPDLCGTIFSGLRNRKILRN